MPDKIVKDQIPPGLTLRHTLRGQHEEEILQLAWSPGGEVLASGSYDSILCLWDAQTGYPLQNLTGHIWWVMSVAWSPDGRVLASGSSEHTVRLWDPQTGKHLRTLDGHAGDIESLAWSPDGRILASGSYDRTIRLWNPRTGHTVQILRGHTSPVESIAWSPDGSILASGSYDRTIRFWDPRTGQVMQTLRGHKSHVYRVIWSLYGEVLISGFDDKTIGLWDPGMGQQTDILEGHSDAITDLSLSYDGRLLASRSLDGTVYVWRTDTWEIVALLEEVVTREGTSSYRWNGGLAFHPKSPVLATPGKGGRVIRIWDVDSVTLLRTTQKTPSVHYTNAKVVLAGDSGVGKSGLGLALVGQPFVPTESTHGRNIWKFNEQEVEFEGGRKETRETILWDLAGQPGYRLIHQLHLDEVAVALVVFDARSETDPFAGVQYWDRALRQAQLVQGNTAPLLKKFLVAARIDRGGIAASPERIQSLVQNLGFNRYFETSAK